MIGAAVFVPGVDLPVLTLNQLRLVLRIAAAHGFEVGPARMPEALGIIGAALGFRAVARSLAGLVPGRRLGRQGRRRLHRHTRARRGGRARLRGALPASP